MPRKTMRRSHLCTMRDGASMRPRPDAAENPEAARDVLHGWLPLQ